MPIEIKIALVANSCFALDFRTDVIICVNGGDNIEIIAVSRNLRPHSRPVRTRRQHVLPSFTTRPIFGDSRSIAVNAAVTSRIVRIVNVVGVRRKLDTLVENSAIAIHTRLSQHTLHEKIEEAAR